MRDPLAVRAVAGLLLEGAILNVRFVAALVVLVSTLIPVPACADVTVVEYYHAAFDHYFVTPVAAEIALLDAHAPPFQDWSRTGFSFNAYINATAPAASVAICRFFNDHFAPKSSHFYAAHGLGCETTLAVFPDWGLEDDKLFNTMLPDATGACPTGTIPVYRLYNQGMGGAPNHRFVTSLVEWQNMLNQGWKAEGDGIGVAMCVLSPVGNRTTAEGLWKGVTDQGQSLLILVLGDGTFHIVFSEKGNETEAGVLYGSSSSIGGSFTSTDVKEYPLSPSTPPFVGGAAAINGTYVPGVSMQLTIGSSSVSAMYIPAYDLPASLSSLAGDYVGVVGHITERVPMTANMDTNGNLTIHGVQCDHLTTATARGVVNVFNISVTSSSCYRGSGVMIYDDVSRKLIALSPSFINPVLGFWDLWYAIAKRQ